MDTQFDFERDGCLLVRNAVPPADLDPLIAHIEAAIDEYAQSLRAKGEISDMHEDLPFPDRLVALNRGTEERLRSWNNIAMGEGLYDVICHPGITRALMPILGPGFGFNGDYHVRPKLPNSKYTAFPWHQDSQYYGADSQHALIVTVWIPLVDVDERNGCLQVMPGSQTWGLLHGKRGADMNMRTNRDIDSMGTAVPLPMRKGDVFLFSNLTFHKSTLNLTDAVRWSIDIRYSRTLDEHELSEQVIASEMFMQNKLAPNRARIPLAGTARRPTWDEWRAELAAKGSGLTKSAAAAFA